jgi:uncharacterized protein involved in exopolysaccharide biosynthesis
MEKTIDQKYLLNLFKRRKASFIYVFLFILIVGFLIAIYLPPVYRSEAMIRIEEQEIPEDFVQPTISEYSEERIEKISQHVLSRTKLKEIVEKYGLHLESKKPKSVEAVAEDLRKNIRLETIVSEMKSKPGGRHLSFTVAFNLSYKGKNPETVQNVTNMLANLYIEEDTKTTEKVISATADFLNSELERFKNEIEIQEKKISEFKKKHIGELPSDLPGNLQIIARLEREYDDANNKLKKLNEQKIFLQGKLRKIEPLTPIVVEGERIAINPSQRLKELNIQLTKLRSVYSEKHPDIKKVKREIRDLEGQVAVSDASVMKIKRLRQLENQYAVMENELGHEHPDVKALRKEIAILTKEVNSLITEKAKTQISEEKPDNPAYITVETQISTIGMEIQSTEEDKRNIENSIVKFQRKLSKTPAVEKELNELTRDYDSAKNKYHEIYNELMSAKVAQQIEGENRGRRFSIASPAYLPTKPFEPNRSAIMMISLLVALGASTLITAFKESLDFSIKTPEQLKKITDIPVLSQISYIETKEEKRKRIAKKSILFVLLISLILFALYYIDQNFVSLEDLGQFVLNRLKMFV